MGAPMPDMEPVENASAEALLSSLKTIDPGERRKHASVFNYWLSIRANRQFPPIRDLDPLEISDAGPWSVLLEMIGGGEDAVIRHFGQEIRGGLEAEKIADAPNPSLLSCIHAKLPIVAACREAFAFEDAFEAEDGPTRCWVTLLPFSANGTWIDFVYGYVSLDGAQVETHAGTQLVQDEPDVAEGTEEATVGIEVEESADETLEPFKMELRPFDEEPVTVEEPAEPGQEEPEAESEAEPVADYEPMSEPETESDDDRPSFTAKLKESLASAGFYGKVADPEPELPVEEFVDEPVEAEPEAAIEPPYEIESIQEPTLAVEGTLQTKLSGVRALAEEARQAQIRSNAALYEGLSAAYDFALDAEAEPEEYLRLVEAQGLKIQLRSPMKPVVRLAFEGQCDEPTIPQLEAVVAWALKQDLPRGSLAERIQAEGGIGAILNGAVAA